MKPIDIKVNLLYDQLFNDKVQFLCDEIPDQEWSGVLLYSVDKWNSVYNNNIGIDVHVVDLIPMAIGSVGYTEFEYNKKTSHGYEDAMVDYFMEHPDCVNENILAGAIHSHNKMDAFFSGVDISELKDNAKSYNFYISMVVNNAGKKVAKIAYHSTVDQEIENQFIVKDGKGDDHLVQTGKECKTTNTTFIANVNIEKIESEAVRIPPEFERSVHQLIVKNCIKEDPRTLHVRRNRLPFSNSIGYMGIPDGLVYTNKHVKSIISKLRNGMDLNHNEIRHTIKILEQYLLDYSDDFELGYDEY